MLSHTVARRRGEASHDITVNDGRASGGVVESGRSVWDGRGKVQRSADFLLIVRHTDGKLSCAAVSLACRMRGAVYFGHLQHPALTQRCAKVDVSHCPFQAPGKLDLFLSVALMALIVCGRAQGAGHWDFQCDVEYP